MTWEKQLQTIHRATDHLVLWRGIQRTVGSLCQEWHFLEWVRMPRNVPPQYWCVTSDGRNCGSYEQWRARWETSLCGVYLQLNPGMPMVLPADLVPLETGSQAPIALPPPIESEPMDQFATLCFWNEDELIALLTLYPKNRILRDSDLSRNLCHALHDAVHVALHRLETYDSLRMRVHVLENTLTQQGNSWVVLDWDLQTIRGSNSGRRNHPSRGNPEVITPHSSRHQEPMGMEEPILSACRRLKTVWYQNAADPRKPTPRIRSELGWSRSGQLANITMVPPLPHIDARPYFVIQYNGIEREGKHIPGRPQVAAPDWMKILRGKLSPAERAVAHYLCAGYSNQEIAHFLRKSVHTVKRQVSAILTKVGLRSRAQLIATVHRRGTPTGRSSPAKDDASLAEPRRKKLHKGT